MNNCELRDNVAIVFNDGNNRYKASTHVAIPGDECQVFVAFGATELEAAQELGRVLARHLSLANCVDVESAA